MDPTAYTVIKTLHVLGATVLFGVGLGTAFHFWLAHRTGRVEVIAAVARSTVLADFVFTLPAVILQPVTGYALARGANFPLDAPWIVASLLLYVVAGACWVPVVFIQMRMTRLAEQSLREGSALPPGYHRLFRTWFWLGWPAFASLIAVFWLMVAKP